MRLRKWFPSLCITHLVCWAWKSQQKDGLQDNPATLSGSALDSLGLESTAELGVLGVSNQEYPTKSGFWRKEAVILTFQ
jgi:hypothetical protein